MTLNILISFWAADTGKSLSILNARIHSAKAKLLPIMIIRRLTSKLVLQKTVQYILTYQVT